MFKLGKQLAVIYGTHRLYCFLFSDKYENKGFYQRLTLINRDFPGANIILHKLGIMPEVRVT